METFFENSILRDFLPAQFRIDNLCKLLAQKDYSFLSAEKTKKLLCPLENSS